MMPHWFLSCVFYSFALMLLLSAFGVVIAGHPVRSALSLVMAFVAAAALWVIQSAEFLGWVLILVYVGAVMTLFLFVVMMLDLGEAQSAPLPRIRIWTVFLGALWFAFLWMGLIGPRVVPVNGATSYGWVPPLTVKDLGVVLYTDYAVSFEVAGLILLSGIIAAVALAYHGARARRSQNPYDQVRVEPSERLSVIKMPPEERDDSSCS